MPVHDSAPWLQRCLDSLREQTLSGIEIVIVDDGSGDGSAEIAAAFAKAHEQVTVVTQDHRGVGPARDAGVQVASGRFLAFCDSDDEVPLAAYERLVGALSESGSDLAVGSVSLQHRGIYRQPEWTRRSHRDRRLSVTLDQVPEIVANLLPGARVFRRQFWDDSGLRFGDDDHAEVVTMVRALLAARRLDVLIGVTYRWSWREDGRSLLQRDLREPDRVASKVARLGEAGDLVLAHASTAVQREFFAGVLHTIVSDLVRAAVCREDAYWSVLRRQLRDLMAKIPEPTLEDVPVEDRIIAWLCARAERGAVEEFLAYSFDNRSGYPFRMIDGHPHIALPFIDALSTLDVAMTRVSRVDMRFQSRLTAMRWLSPGVLRVEGAAFVDYLPDEEHETVVLVVRRRGSGSEVVIPVQRVHDPAVNRWAGRAHEDHSHAAFTCDIDVAALPRDADSAVLFDVVVRLDSREGPFRTRRAVGSPGLLEETEGDGFRAVPVWQPVRGLGLRVGSSVPGTPATPSEPQASVEVNALTGTHDKLTLLGVAVHDLDLALVGPGTRTGWCAARRDGDTFTVEVSLLLDEWGLGPASLPSDEYAVTARAADGSEVPVVVARDLWRELPDWVDVGSHLLHPLVSDDGHLRVRVTPGEQRDSTGAFARRRLRDEHYPSAREQSLLEVALIETFSGRAAGDNPGPLGEELRARDIEVVFTVGDRSIAVPDGARRVIRHSVEWYELLGRARYLVTNDLLPPFFRKRPEQVLVQTWHGTPLKRIGHDRISLDFANWHHRRHLLAARNGWDFLVSQSRFCTMALRSAFHYEGEVLEHGYPRNDLLSSREARTVRERTRAALGIDHGTLVVLYAPTWRDTRRIGRVFDKVLYLDTTRLVAEVPDTVVLVRGHYQSLGAPDVGRADRRVLDVTRYPDISHLYLAADALVTDYSSVFFDFVLTDKPMYFLAPDLDEYRDDQRGFYLDYHQTVPGPIAVSTEEVIAAMKEPDRYSETRRRFRSEFAPWDDGHAAERIIDVLLRDRAQPTER